MNTHVDRLHSMLHEEMRLAFGASRYSHVKSLQNGCLYVIVFKGLYRMGRPRSTFISVGQMSSINAAVYVDTRCADFSFQGDLYAHRLGDMAL